MLRAYEGKISRCSTLMFFDDVFELLGESPVLAIGLYLIGAQSFNANLAP